MKNRKFIVVAFMLTACMIVGVGYAAVTDTFNLNGTATISQENANDGFNQEIVFAGIVTKEGVVSDVTDHATHGYTASVNIASDIATYHVYSLKKNGDSQEIVFRIANNGKVAAQICIQDAVTKNGNEDMFSVTYSAKNTEGTWVEIKGHEDIPAGGSIDIQVVVEVVGHVSETVTADFGFTFNVVDDVNNHDHGDPVQNQ